MIIALSSLPSLSFSANRYNGIHYFLVVMSLIGFIFFDLLYIAIVINYITQCELLRFFIRNVREKVVTKEYLLGYAVKVSECMCFSISYISPPPFS